MPATLSAFDLTFATDDLEVKVMVQRPQQRAGARTGRPLSVVANPVRAGDRFDQQENEATYADWSGGAGYGERLAANVYHYGLPFHGRTPFLGMPPGRVTRYPGVPQMNGPVRGHFFSRNDLFFAGGNRGLRIPLGTGTPYVDQNLNYFSSFAATSAVGYGVDGDGYIGGIGGGIWRFDGNLNTWDQSDEVAAMFLASVYWVRGNSGSQKLVRSTVPTTDPVAHDYPSTSILYTDNDNPMTEALWSDEILIGNPAYSITGLAASNQYLWTLKSNGLHELDDRLYSPNVTAYRTHDKGGFKATAVHNGHVYFGHTHGLERVAISEQGVRQDRPQACGFGFGLPNYGPIRGEPVAMCNENGWLATAFYNATTDTSYICYGADYRDLGVARPGIGGPLLWHGAEAVISGRVSYMTVFTPTASGQGPRLYVWSYTTDAGGLTYTTALDWISLPESGSPIQDLLEGGPWQAADEWGLFLPRETWDSETSRKDQTLLSFRSDGLGSAVIDAYRAVEGGDFEAESLGQASGDYDEFAVDAETDARDMTFKVVGRGGPTNPAMLKAMVARAAISVEASNTLTYLIEFGDGVPTHAARQQREDPAWTEAKIEAMQGHRVTLADHRRRRTYSARLLQASRLDWEEYPSGEKSGKVTGTLTFQILESIIRLDEGHVLDVGLRLA